MKRLLYFATISLVLLSGNACKKNETYVKVDDTEKPERKVYTFNIGMENCLTKAVSDMSDKNINTCQIFIFRGGNNSDKGLLDAESGIINGSSVNIECTVGSADIFALVNAPKISVKNIDELKTKVSKLADNASGAFVMSGYINKNISSSGGSITIPVKRLAAKVQLNKVEVNFKNQVYQKILNEGRVKIIRMYLLNYATSYKYDFSFPTELALSNKGSYSDQSLNNLTLDNVNHIFSSQAKTYTTGHTFYCYPNNTENKTRLVVEFEIDGKLIFYPVTFDKIESNHLYNITQLTITKLGAGNPDTVVEDASMSFEIQVQDWIEEKLEDERI